jgi:error-prone DNA polymerase
VDALLSDWLSTMERSPDGTPALRLGLHMIRNLPHAAGACVVAARQQGPVLDVEDLARRAGLDKRALNALAASDALASLSGHRRNALWQTLGIDADTPLLAEARIQEPPCMLSPPSEGENVVADYAHLGLSLRRHPLAILRPRLRSLKLASSEDLRTARDGQLLRVAGLVTCRQRPATKSGVTFLTLEDESGCINVVVWRDIAERQRRELLNARLLGIDGKVERQGTVIHLIAARLTDHSRLLGNLLVRGRDFH